MPDSAEQNINTPGRVGSYTYAELESKRRLCRDLMGETDAVRANIGAYVPQFTGEAWPEYEERYKGAPVTPWFPNAVGNLVGKPFRKELKLGEDVPLAIRGTPAKEGKAAVEGWAENADLRGTHLHLVAAAILTDWLAEGVRGVLVDHQRTALPANPSVEDMKRAGRPYLTPLFAADVIELLYADVNGRQVVDRLKRRATRYVKLPIGQKAVDQVFVYHRGVADGEVEGGGRKYCRWELYEPDDKGQWPPVGSPTEQGELSPHVEIPVSFMPVGLPPLLGLAHMCIQDFKEDIDLATHRRATLRITLLLLGFTKTEVDEGLRHTGGLRLVHTSRGPGEADGKMIEAGVGAQAAWSGERDKRHELIRLAALEPLLPDKTQTLGERRIASGEAHARLQVWTLLLKDLLETVLGYMAGYHGEKSGGSVIVGEDYLKEGPQQAALQDVQSMRAAGDISRRSAWKIRQQIGTLPDDFSAEDEEAELSKEQDTDEALRPAGQGPTMMERAEALAVLLAVPGVDPEAAAAACGLPGVKLTSPAPAQRLDDEEGDEEDAGPEA